MPINQRPVKRNLRADPPPVEQQTFETNIQQPASGKRPFIIPIFLPHAGCPHHCVFCNQISITGNAQQAVNTNHIRSQIHRFLEYNSGQRKPVQISFYGGNFLGLSTEKIKILLDLAAEFVRQDCVDGIRFSTRPDTIIPEHLDLIANYPVDTVELGVQSMDDHVLKLSRRGHCAADTTRAVERLREHQFEIGLQLMVGLPGDTKALTLSSAEKMAELRPDFVRIYPTIVVKNSLLARWYQKGSYTPLSLAEAVDRVKNIYLLFKRYNIRVIRMGLQASEDLANGSTVLAGPYHPSFGHLVYSEIFYEAAQKAIDSIRPLSDTITIAVNPRSIPKMRGINNLNIQKLKERYQLKEIAVVPDSSLAIEELRVG